MESHWIINTNICWDGNLISERMWSSGREIEKYTTGSESVALRRSVWKFIKRVIQDLQHFRRHPIQSSLQSALRKSPLRTHFFTKTKIRQFHVNWLSCRDEDVVRFDVAMHKIPRMDEIQSDGDLVENQHIWWQVGQIRSCVSFPFHFGFLLFAKLSQSSSANFEDQKSVIRSTIQISKRQLRQEFLGFLIYFHFGSFSSSTCKSFRTFWWSSCLCNSISLCKSVSFSKTPTGIFLTATLFPSKVPIKTVPNPPLPSSLLSSILTKKMLKLIFVWNQMGMYKVIIECGN